MPDPRHNVRTVLILGEDEVAAGLVTVRPLDGGAQTQIPLTNIVDQLIVGS